MAHAFQTTIEPDATRVIVIAPSAVFTTQLSAALSSVHLIPEVVSPENLRDEQVRAGYMCLLVDIPVFGESERKKKAFAHALSVLHRAGQIPVLLITFDASKSRKTGVSPRDPTVVTQWIVSAASQALKLFRHVDYLHVLYPYEAGYSTVARFVLEKIAGGDTRKIQGEFQPIWYSDVITHVLSLIYDPTTPAGIFSGRENVVISAFEHDIRSVSSHAKVGNTLIDFPYEFKTPSQSIGRVGYQTMVQEFSLIVPPPHQEPFADTPIDTPLLIPKKTPKKKRFSKKTPGIFFGILLCCYITATALFITTFFQTRTLLKTYVTSDEQLFSPAASVQLDRNLSLLRGFVRSVPFPYTLIGQTLATDRIASGIDGMRELVAMQALFSKKREELYGARLLEGETVFDEVYQSLSAEQASLGQGDLTFDLVFGLDGLSSRLVQKIAIIRQAISKEKAVASFFPTLFGKNARSTVALIRMTPAQDRPLFGIPSQVSVLTLEGGEILTAQDYTPEVLNTLMKGTTQPPEEMKASLGITNWRFSDGAWSVDGPTAAKELLWFLTKELHTEIDGVLLIDVQAGRELSKFTGMEKTLASAKILGVQSVKTDALANLRAVDLLQTLLDTKQATLFARDKKVSETLRALSWDGAIETPNCPAPFSQEKNCVVSTRYVTDYLIRATSADDQVLQKKEQHSIVLGEGGTHHTDTLIYAPIARGNQDILVKYLVDQDAVFSSISIDGEEQDISLFSQSLEFHKKVLVVPLHRNEGRETRLELAYDTAPVKKDESALVFFVQKEPGRQNPELSLTIHYPREYTAKSIAPRAYSSAQSSSFEERLDTSKLFAISF